MKVINTKKKKKKKKEINDGSERKTKSIRWNMKGNDTIGAQ